MTERRPKCVDIVPKRARNIFNPDPSQFHSMLRTSIASLLFTAVEDMKRGWRKKHRLKLIDMSNPLKGSFIFWIGRGYPNPNYPVLNVGMNSKVGPGLARVDIAYLLPYINDEERTVSIGDSDASWLISNNLLKSLEMYNLDREMPLDLQQKIKTFFKFYE